MYALIKNNTVHGHIDTDAQTAADITAAGEYLAVECVGIPQNDSIYDPGTGSITPPVPVVIPVQRHLAVGSFFDRFGALKYAILASADPGVQALIKDCSVRKYIDLDNDQLPYGLDMLIATGYAIDKTAILTAPIAESEKP